MLLIQNTIIEEGRDVCVRERKKETEKEGDALKDLQNLIKSLHRRTKERKPFDIHLLFPDALHAFSM